MFGTLKVKYLHQFSDLNLFELGVFVILIVFILILGVSNAFVVTFIQN